MLEGRVKPDGNLESWARSRSTNLLDSDDPSTNKIIQNSRSDYLLNSRQDMQQHHLSSNQAGTNNTMNNNILVKDVRVTQGGMPDVSITDYLQPNDTSHISIDQNQKFHYTGQTEK